MEVRGEMDTAIRHIEERKQDWRKITLRKTIGKNSIFDAFKENYIHRVVRPEEISGEILA